MTATFPLFQDAIRAAGLEPTTVIEPGKFHRFPGKGKCHNNRSGWCILFDDGLAGCFGDWSTGFTGHWMADRDKPYSNAERTEFAKQVAAAKKKAKAERYARQADAKNRAAKLLNKSKPAPGNHPYLMCKRIQAHRARLLNDSLVLPVVDFDVGITSLQFIGPNGDKRLLSGGRKQGCFIPVAMEDNPPSRLIISEGWATGCTLAEAHPSAMVIATCATAAARRLRVEVRPGYTEPCNLWLVAALPPGNRKSGVQGAATEPLLAWERDQTAVMDSEIKRITSERKTMEARAKEKRNKAARAPDNAKSAELARGAADIEAELPEIPAAPQLWTSDATPERLGALLAEHGECMAWLSSEGGVFDLLQGRYSNGIPNLDLVLKAHSGDAERVDRGSRPPVFLKYPRLSIGLSPQPDVLRGLAAKPGFRGRGLLGRILYLLPPSMLGHRPLETNPVPEGDRDAYEQGIRAMLDWEPATDEHGDKHPHLLELSEDAFTLHHDFAKAIEVQMQPGQDLEHFTDWAGKAPGAAARLAGVLHGIKHAHSNPWEVAIAANTMKSAVELMAVFTGHSLAALDMMGADPTVAAARQVWEWVERGRLAHFTAREAFQQLRAHFPRMPKLWEALDALVERGYVEVIEPPRDGPGRPPSPLVRVRPDIAKGWA